MPWTLYISPVLCKVYRLRSKGQRLPTDALVPVAGELRVHVSPIPPKLLVMALMDDRGHPHLTLEDARLVKIRQGGMLFTGTEHQFEGCSANLYSAHYRQTWWCVAG